MDAEAKVQRWFSKRQLGDRYSVCTRSIDRWVAAGRFPAGTKMPTGRMYWSDREIEKYERQLVARYPTVPASILGLPPDASTAV
jgi:predicted DNA-binding transcriptional regulator AlpA